MRFAARLIPGLGGILAIWLFMPRAIVDREPYLQVVGHYSAPGTTPLAIGSGPAADIRLTETGVAELHGWLIRTPSLRYVQASTSQGSQRIPAGKVPGKPLNSFLRLRDGDAVDVYHGPQLLRTDVIHLVNARAIELSSPTGEMRKTLLPERDDRAVALADADGTVRSWLIRCGGKVGFSAAPNCAGGFQSLALLQRIGFWWRAPVRPPAGAPLPQWLRNGWVRKGAETQNAFAEVNGRSLQFIPEVNETLDADVGVGYALYRSGRKAPLPRIARVGNYDQHVIVRRSNTAMPLGETEVKNGDVLALGDTYFQVGQSPTGEITLRAVEKYDRFHFFYSLSAGRLNFGTRLQPVGGDAAHPLTIAGISGSGAAAMLPSPETPSTSTSPTVWRLPVASRFSAASPQAARISITNVHAEGRERALRAVFKNAPQNRGPADLFPSDVSIGDGDATHFAGHLFSFHAHTPRFEQIFPAIGMCLALLILGYLAQGAVAGATVPSRNHSSFEGLLRAFTGVALGCISFLIMAGVLIMSRMATLDMLIGKPDYYHRQLFYSYLTAAVITAIICGLHRRDRQDDLAIPAWMGFPLSLPAMLFAAGLLLLWQLADFIGFHIAARERVEGSIGIQLLVASMAVALFIVTGYAVLRFEGTKKKILTPLVFAALASEAVVLFFKGMVTIGAVVIAILVVWLIVYAVSWTPPRLRLSDLSSDGEVSWWRYWAGRIRERRRRVRAGWGVLQARHRMLIVIGIAVLASGRVIGSGRDALGVKPAEFAVWFLAPGICAMLAVDFQRMERRTRDEARAGVIVLGPGWPQWSRRALDPLLPRTARMRDHLARRWQETLIGVLTAVMLFILIVYSRLISPGLIAAVFVPLILLVALAWWTERPEDEGNKDDWCERLRVSIRLYVPVLLTILVIELVVNAIYVLEGDFGPLMVLVPSIGFLILVWAVSPEHSEMATSATAEPPAAEAAEGEPPTHQPPPPPSLRVSRSRRLAAASRPRDPENPSLSSPPRRQLFVRTVIVALFLGTCLWGGVVAWQLVQAPIAAELAGPSATRATKRFLTRSAPWYTKEGSWSTDALWIANGYYERERMLANLHSDLVFVALVQSFGLRRALIVLGVFAVLVAFSFASLGVKMSRWSGTHADPTVRLQSHRITLLLYFAGIYLTIEVIVHLGSSLNAIWQTGVTLPWISSGGSASLGFGGLCAIALALAVTGLMTAELRADEQENSES